MLAYFPNCGVVVAHHSYGYASFLRLALEKIFGASVTTFRGYRVIDIACMQHLQMENLSCIIQM